MAAAFKAIRVITKGIRDVINGTPVMTNQIPFTTTTMALVIKGMAKRINRIWGVVKGVTAVTK